MATDKNDEFLTNNYRFSPPQHIFLAFSFASFSFMVDERKKKQRQQQIFDGSGKNINDNFELLLFPIDMIFRFSLPPLNWGRMNKNWLYSLKSHMVMQAKQCQYIIDYYTDR